MKVLFTTENIDWGGSELLWSMSAVEMAKLGYNVVALVERRLQIPEKICRQLIDNKVELVYYSLTRNFLKRQAKKLRLNFGTQQRKLGLMIKFNPNLVVLSQGFNFNAAYLFEGLSEEKIQFVTISQAVNEFFWPEQRLRKTMRKGYQKSLKNYFVSKDNLEVTQSQIGVFLDNAEVVHNPYHSYVEQSGKSLDTSTLSMACVGRFEINAKGQDALLRALAARKWRDRNLQLNFYGSGRDEQCIKDMINLYGINNVRVCGYTSPDKIWNDNHCLILTSRYEGLPIVLVEAMMAYRFAIVTDVSGSAEVINDGVDGFVIPAPRVHYIDEVLEKVWLQRDNWIEIGQRAGQTIRQIVPKKPEQVFALKLKELLNEHS